MRYVVAKVKCCGKAHEIRLSEAGAIVASSHRGVHATAAASVQAMGAPVRCLEVLADWQRCERGRINGASVRDLAEFHRLPEPLRRVLWFGMERTLAHQEKRSPEAKRANRLTHAKSKVKELDQRVRSGPESSVVSRER